MYIIKLLQPLIVAIDACHFKITFYLLTQKVCNYSPTKYECVYAV